MRVILPIGPADIYTDGDRSSYSYQLAPCGALTILLRDGGYPGRAHPVQVYASGSWKEVKDATLYRGD